MTSILLGDSTPPVFSCMEESSVTVPLTALCDGVDNCGPAGGEEGRDETATICDSELTSSIFICCAFMMLAF